MWINLKCQKPFAIKIFVGGVNAVSGETMQESPASIMRRLTKISKDESVQDYVVPPKQLWIDGIANEKGSVRQFVAMPLGSGYSVEAQITGKEVTGGLQFQVIPCSKYFGMEELVCKNHIEGDQIIVQIDTMSGRKLALHGVSLANTLEDLKDTVFQVQKIPKHEQHFVYQGKRLDDSKYWLEDDRASLIVNLQQAVH